MSDNEKPNFKDLKIIIDPDALAEMEEEMEPEELQKFLNELTEAVRSGKMFEDSEPVDMDKLMIEDPELYQKLINREQAFREEDDKQHKLH